MKMLTFARRCARELLRDPINLIFGLGFPLVLLLLLSSLQANIPVPLFEIDTLTPGITVFGLSFLTLFSATLVARDRESAFLQRLYTTPLTGADFILGYLLPILPLALGQSLVCFLFAIPLGLTVKIHILYAVLGILPMAVFNISLGLLFGTLFNEKSAPGVCSIIISLGSFLGSIWFDAEGTGGVLLKISQCLPFHYCTKSVRAAMQLQIDLGALWLPLLVSAVCAALLVVAASVAFRLKMKADLA